MTPDHKALLERLDSRIANYPNKLDEELATLIRQQAQTIAELTAELDREHSAYEIAFDQAMENGQALSIARAALATARQEAIETARRGWYEGWGHREANISCECDEPTNPAEHWPHSDTCRALSPTAPAPGEGVPWNSKGPTPVPRSTRPDVAGLVDALRAIGKQKRVAEMSEEFYDAADFEGGCDTIIEIARAELAKWENSRG